MASTRNLDPFEMWRQVVTKLEGDINSMANKSMSSEEFARVLGQFSPVAIVMQQIFEMVLDRYFKALRIPSQKDINALAQGLQRLEDKLDTLLVNEKRGPEEERPLRTRRPSGSGNVAAKQAKASTSAAKARR